MAAYGGCTCSRYWGGSRCRRRRPGCPWCRPRTLARRSSSCTATTSHRQSVRGRPRKGMKLCLCTHCHCTLVASPAVPCNPNICQKTSKSEKQRRSLLCTCVFAAGRCLRRRTRVVVGLHDRSESVFAGHAAGREGAAGGFRALVTGAPVEVVARVRWVDADIVVNRAVCIQWEWVRTGPRHHAGRAAAASLDAAHGAEAHGRDLGPRPLHDLGPAHILALVRNPRVGQGGPRRPDRCASGRGSRSKVSGVGMAAAAEIACGRGGRLSVLRLYDKWLS